MEKLSNELAKELLEYISKNLFIESPFLSPNHQANIEVIGLLDKIAELRGIDNIENGLEFNEIRDRHEAESYSSENTNETDLEDF